MGLGDWLDKAVDFGSDLFDSASDKVGAIWDWGVKSPAAMGAIAGVGKGVLSYMGAKDAPSASKEQIEYYERRRAEHNLGISKAAQRYKPKVVKPIPKLGG